MSEFIKTAEVVGNVAEKVFRAGKFVVNQFKIESWAKLPGDPTPRVGPPPAPANVQIFDSEEDDEDESGS